jgi:hypothetical protein
MEAVDIRVAVTVAIVRGVAVTPSNTDNRIPRVIRIAATVAATVGRSRGTAMPAVPRGFGRNCQWRNDCNQAEKVAEQMPALAFC